MSIASNKLLETSFESMASGVARNEVKGNDVLGLGSGSAVARFARALGERARNEADFKVRVIPSSLQSWLLAKENGLSLAEDSGHCPQEIDVAVDGADQISLSTRAMIKGGGGALLKEKIIISSAKRCYILADESKFVPRNLTRPVPVEVTPFSVLTVESKLRSIFGGTPALRKLDKGYPFVTESGNLILDLQFPSQGIPDPIEAELKIK